MAAPPLADWYPDPFGRHEQRFWDGSQWTHHVTAGGRQGIDPPAGEAHLASCSRTVQARAGWYPDPMSRHERRYWDGSRWTDHIVSNGQQGVDPIAAATSVTEAVHGTPNQNVAWYPPRPQAAGTQPGDGALFTEPVLVVNQKARLFGSNLGYGITDQHGHPLALVAEVDRNLGSRANDALRGRTDHDYKLQVSDITGRVVLTLARPELSPVGWRAVLVGGAEGIAIGQIIQETLGLRGSVTNLAHQTLNNVSALVGPGVGFVAGYAVGHNVAKTAGKAVGKGVGWVAGKGAAWAGRTATDVTGVSALARFAAGWLDPTSGHVRFGLEAGGHRLGSIHAENVEKWDFRVDNLEGTEIARVTKTWAGWGKETFTNADHYVVQIHQPLDGPLRALVIAAALAIDLSLKQGDPAMDTPPSNRHS